MRGVRPVIAACVAALTASIVEPAAAAPRAADQAGAIPTTWEHHAEAPWSWWSPPGWVDAHGPTDLNVSSPTGTLWAKIGYSEALVLVPGGTPRQNAAAWFDAWAAHLRGTPDMYGLGLTAMRYTGVSAIAEFPPTIPAYSDAFRQVRTYAGTATDGTRILGELVMDYVESNYGDVGIEDFKARATPRSVFDTKIGKLRKIQHYTTYTGSLT